MEKLYSRYTELKQFYKFIPKEKEKIQIVNVTYAFSTMINN